MGTPPSCRMSSARNNNRSHRNSPSCNFSPTSGGGRRLSEKKKDSYNDLCVNKWNS